MKKLFIAIIFLLLGLPLVAADTGWWQSSHEDNDIQVLLSPAPFSPLAGENVSMVISFVNKTQLLTHVQFNIVILKLGEQIFESPTLAADNGISESYKYRFAEPGFYEMLLVFNSTLIPGQTFHADFPIQIREANVPNNFSFWILFFAAGVAIGFLLPKLTKLMKRKYI